MEPKLEVKIIPVVSPAHFVCCLDEIEIALGHSIYSVELYENGTFAKNKVVTWERGRNVMFRFKSSLITISNASLDGYKLFKEIGAAAWNSDENQIVWRELFVTYKEHRNVN